MVKRQYGRNFLTPVGSLKPQQQIFHPALNTAFFVPDCEMTHTVHITELHRLHHQNLDMLIQEKIKMLKWFWTKKASELTTPRQAQEIFVARALQGSGIIIPEIISAWHQFHINFDIRCILPALNQTKIHSLIQTPVGMKVLKITQY